MTFSRLCIVCIRYIGLTEAPAEMEGRECIERVPLREYPLWGPASSSTWVKHSLSRERAEC